VRVEPDHRVVATRERRIDRGADTSRRLRTAIGAEIRIARRGCGLALRDVAGVVGCSPATLSRLERGLMVNVSVDLLARVAATVGLDLSVRVFPGGQPLRDAAQIALLAAFRARLHPGIRWSTEVPLPIQGDLRRWDGMISAGEWRNGVEAETAARDWQALAGRIELKRRDGRVDGVILVLPETRRTRAFLQAAATFTPSVFPVPARQVLARLAAGQDPGGSGIVVLRVPRGQPRPGETRG